MTRTQNVYALTALGLVALPLGFATLRAYPVPAEAIVALLFALMTVGVGGAVLHVCQWRFDEYVQPRMKNAALGLVASLVAHLLTYLPHASTSFINQSFSWFALISVVAVIANGLLLLWEYVSAL